MTINLKQLIAKLDVESRAAMQNAANRAVLKSHFEIDIEHLLWGLIDSSITLQKMFLQLDLNVDVLKHKCESLLILFKTGNTKHPVISKNVTLWLEKTWMTVSMDENTQGSVRAIDLLYVLLNDSDLSRLLNIDTGVIEWLPSDKIANYRSEYLSRLNTDAETSLPATPQNVKQALQKYTVNYIELALKGNTDEIVGRDFEVNQLIDVLMRRRQNNPILVGEAGVGKTAIVESLAYKIINKQVPTVLQDVLLLGLDLGLLQAGASVKGEFEQRLKDVMSEVKNSEQPVIMFIDEAHMMIGAGGAEGQADVANMLKPALARGEFRTIAATTWKEYKKYFEKDSALTRRFEVVKVDEPSIANAISMLRGVAVKLQDFHQVKILDSAITAAVSLSSRYMIGRQLPDKAVSVLDTACAKVVLSQNSLPWQIVEVEALIKNLEIELKMLQAELGHADRIQAIESQMLVLKENLIKLHQNYSYQKKLCQQIQSINLQEQDGLEKLTQMRCELKNAQTSDMLCYDCVDEHVVADVVSSQTGIPLGRLDQKEYVTQADLYLQLNEKVVGQSYAMQEISKNLTIAKAKLNDPTKPKGVFLLVGPSGVGKTETALSVADLEFGGTNNMITINMSEYQERHSVSGLKGSPPGYVGYGEGGVLTEAVRKKPYSVILLDEVEKAHPDVLELFFQVFDKGVLEDSEGRMVDFKNTIIFLTSNLGSDLVLDAFEHGIKVDGEKVHDIAVDDIFELLRPDLNDFFKPAFLGRLKVVPYLPLKRDVLKQIVCKKLQDISARLLLNYSAVLVYGDDIVDFICERSDDRFSGARKIDDVLNNCVLNTVSNVILESLSTAKHFDQIHLTIIDESIICQLSEKE